MNDTIPVTFLYSLGDRVRWGGYEAVHTIVWRLWRQSETATRVHYGLELTAGRAVSIALEADLIPAEGEV